MKAIALDLDGTLLNSEKIVSPETKEILKELSEKGMEIIIVTGRLYATTLPIVQSLDFPVTVICYNGARVVDANTGEVLFEKNLKPSHVKKLIQFSHNNSVQLNLFQNDRWYVEDFETDGAQYYHKNSKIIPIIKNFDTLNEDNVTKAIIIDEAKILKDIERNLKEILGDEVYYTYSQEKYLEILNGDINKGLTLKNILEEKNIPITCCVAFGDAHNDIEMLTMSGIGVAMGNAHPDVKKIADHVTDSNDENGVANFLKTHRFLFK
jgi:hypothetical protein